MSRAKISQGNNELTPSWLSASTSSSTIPNPADHSNGDFPRNIMTCDVFGQASRRFCPAGSAILSGRIDVAFTSFPNCIHSHPIGRSRKRAVRACEATGYGSLVYRLLTRRDHTRSVMRTAASKVRPTANPGNHGVPQARNSRRHSILATAIRDLILRVGLPPSLRTVRLGRPPSALMSRTRL